MPAAAPPEVAMKSSPVILIGEAPALFAGAVGHRLAELAGIEHEHLSDAFRLRTLLDRSPVGAALPMHVAQYVARKALPQLLGQHVVFYGRGLAMAYGVMPRKPIDWETVTFRTERANKVAGALTFAVLPEDSTQDAFWGPWWDEHADAAAAFLRAIVHPKAHSHGNVS